MNTVDAPPAIGPYSQAIVAGGFLFCSGALPLDPTTGELESGSLAAETRRCLSNLQAVCVAAGTTLANAVRVTIFTTTLSGFAEINNAYAEEFDDIPPARVTVEVSALPKGANVEIDAIVAVA